MFASSRVSRRHYLLGFAALLASVACDGMTGEVQEAVKPGASPVSKVVGDTGQPAPAATSAPTVAASPTPKPEPTPTPAPAQLELNEKGFGRGPTNDVGWAFIVTNPNQNGAIETSSYQVAFYGDDGSVLTTESGYITLILPGQRIGIAGTALVSRELTVDRVDVQVRMGKFTPNEPIPTFTAENITYRTDDWSGKVTGIIKSPFQKDVTNVLVNAVPYDEAGQIIGGGFSYVNFIPAGGQAAAEVNITTSQEPASVELYAMLTSISKFE